MITLLVADHSLDKEVVSIVFKVIADCVGKLVCVCKKMLVVFCEKSWVVLNIVELDEILLIVIDVEVERNGFVVENMNVEKSTVVKSEMFWNVDTVSC